MENEKKKPPVGNPEQIQFPLTCYSAGMSEQAKPALDYDQMGLFKIIW